MRKHSLPAMLISRLASEPQTRCADRAAWQAHLDRLGFTALTAVPDPARVATEGALWGSVQAYGFLCDAVVLSDDAGQFAIGRHALCWVHAERLIHKLDTFNDRHRAAQALPVRNYSSGMVVRLAFAMATASHPEILLMDEWILAGDAGLYGKGKTTHGGDGAQGRYSDPVASHSSSIISEWCNRVIWLEQGPIAGQATSRSARLEVAASSNGAVSPSSL